MPYCSAVGCQSDSSAREPTNREGISFYRLPAKREKAKRQAWIANLKREGGPPQENIRVCSRHFDENQYEVDYKVNAFPSYFGEGTLALDWVLQH